MQSIGLVLGEACRINWIHYGSWLERCVEFSLLLYGHERLDGVNGEVTTGWLSKCLSSYLLLVQLVKSRHSRRQLCLPVCAYI